MTLRLTVALAAALIALSAVTTGGVALAPNTWSELVLIGLGGLALGALTMRGTFGGREGGLLAAILFAALTIETAASIGWSVSPELSWVESGRTLSYLALFIIGAVLARLMPRRATALLSAIALSSVAIAGWALLVKVFSWQAFDQIDNGRLLAPYSYWNATGLIAALGLPCLMWAGSRGSGAVVLRGLAVAGITLLVPVVILSYSRSALAAAIVGSVAIVWFSQRRLRALAAAALGLLGGAAVSIWALGTPGITRDLNSPFTTDTTLPQRIAAGHDFGVVLLIAAIVVTGLGSVLHLYADAGALPARVRGYGERALRLAPAAVVCAAIAALVLSARGPFGEISHLWDKLTTTHGHTLDVSSRLGSLESTRPNYWRQALDVGDHHVLAGAGAGAFGIAYLAYPSATLTVRGEDPHAHGYLFETFATLGLIGLVLTLALALVWVIVACRSIGGRLAGRSASQADNRDVLLGLGTVCLTFAVSSAIDWTWFIPGVAAPALLAAGWLAGVERRARPAVREHSRRGPVLAAIITVLAIGTILAGYEIWRPLHAQQLSDAASAALASGDGQTALADAQDARSADPDSLFPLQQLSAIYWAAGERGPAEAELVQATRLQPSNPQSWSALGGYLVCWGHQLQRARTVLLRATALDFTNAYNEADLLNSVTNPDAPSQRALRKQLCANVPA